MSLYIYPAGAIIAGVPTEHRTVLRALPFTLNNICYPPVIFERWTQEELARLGIKLWVEDAVPVDMLGGIPEDTESAFIVHRAYPNAAPDAAAIKARKQTAILAELAALDTFVPRSVEEMYLINNDCGLHVHNIERVERKIVLRDQLANL